jgi:hypothetical protein
VQKKLCAMLLSWRPVEVCNCATKPVASENVILEMGAPSASVPKC